MSVLQMNSEANNLVPDSDHHNACPSVHVNKIGSVKKENEDRPMVRFMVTAREC